MRGSKAEEILHKIAEEHSFSLQAITPLAGGDINEVFSITTSSGVKYAVKLNDPEKYPGMFDAEKAGLEALSKTGTFTSPGVIGSGIIASKAYLLLEFVDSSNKSENFWALFGERLAKLHRNSDNKFGFFQDNYIGTLPQYNALCNTAADFYISQRLEPQFRLARQQGHDLKNLSFFLKRCQELIPDEPPSLIHGDLWNGNYLCDSGGEPGLIDPAVAYAPREMDLAMMKLFGGFDAELFKSYKNHFPLTEGWEERLPLWQLYYLLVHLNIFGTSYKSRVTAIIKRYS